MQYFTCNAGNTNKYKYFRLIANKIGNSGTGNYRDYVSIGTWDLYTQMNTVIGKLYAKFQIFCKIRWKIEKKMAITMVKSFILPKIENPWHGGPATTISTSLGFTFLEKL